MKKVMGCVEIYEDFITEEQAQNLIKICEDVDKDPEFEPGFKDASVGKGHKGGDIRSNKTFNITEYHFTHKESRLYRESVKNGNDKYFHNINNVQELISSKLQQYVNEYTKKYEFPIMFDEGYTLLRYTGGQEYKAHCDYAPHMPRYLSALILLNPSEYEGGGTYFVHFDENIKPEKPALVLFPSNYAYAHRAMPIISGTKYAIVTWLGHQIDTDGLPEFYLPKG
jgi:hypothetical protein|tara:strand:- start:7544 stop:8218 length:675 start_codon:yes stop_codon:yes gene_type:complete